MLASPVIGALHLRRSKSEIRNPLIRNFLVLSFWQRLQGLLYPVSIRKGSSPLNPVLELFYYHGRYILGTQDAVYSDGNRYRPLVAAFTAPALRDHLPRVRDVLVLGTGLASAVHVLDRYGYRPRFTLVEIDALVLDWAVEFLPEGTVATPVCANAFGFIATDEQIYDLIIVDLFFGREVPAVVTQHRFLQQCRSRLEPGGHLVLNYMVNRDEDEDRAKKALKAVFNDVTELSFGINRVYIAG